MNETEKLQPGLEGDFNPECMLFGRIDRDTGKRYLGYDRRQAVNHELSETNERRDAKIEVHAYAHPF